MNGSPMTLWEQAQARGVSRRDFIRYCSWLAAAAGIEASAIGQVVQAMEKKTALASGVDALPGMYVLQ